MLTAPASFSQWARRLSSGAVELAPAPLTGPQRARVANLLEQLSRPGGDDGATRSFAFDIDRAAYQQATGSTLPRGQHDVIAAVQLLRDQPGSAPVTITPVVVDGAGRAAPARGFQSVVASDISAVADWLRMGEGRRHLEQDGGDQLAALEQYQDLVARNGGREPVSGYDLA